MPNTTPVQPVGAGLKWARTVLDVNNDCQFEIAVNLSEADTVDVIHNLKELGCKVEYVPAKGTFRVTRAAESASGKNRP